MRYGIPRKHIVCLCLGVSEPTGIGPSSQTAVGVVGQEIGIGPSGLMMHEDAPRMSQSRHTLLERVPRNNRSDR